MDISDIRLKQLGLERRKFGRVAVFIDYGNVNYWYDRDDKDSEDQILKEGSKLIVDLERLSRFCNHFSIENRFYYGWNPRNQSNWHMVIKAEKLGFIKITKPIQFIKHRVGEAVLSRDGRPTRNDKEGRFVEIPKSNFDVEISVDAIRIVDRYDTFCLFSGDSDFAYLARFIKRAGKKIIVIASGKVFHTLKEVADLYINAQDIKGNITTIKTSPQLGRGLDIGSASGGQGSEKLRL